MQFLYPAFLYALPLILIPIIIHLFNFRRYKTVYYSNINLLKQVKEQNKSVRRLKNILTLLFRILAIATLIIVFAGPYIPPENNTINNNMPVVIYADNSFSTEAEGQNGRLFETVKSKAQAIADAYDENRSFLFLNNDLNPKHLHFTSQKQVKEFISESKLSGYTHTIGEIIKRIQSMAKEQNPQGNAEIYIISDFQKTITDIENFPNDTNLKISLIPLKPEINQNIFIDSISFSNPYRALNRHEQLQVKIVNTSDQDYISVPLRLYINDSLKVPSVFDIKANSTITTNLEYINTKSGDIKGRLEIDDYPVTFDNSFYFSLRINEHRKVLAISDKDNLKYISSVVADDDYFIVNEERTERIKLSELPQYDVLVMNSPKKISSGLTGQIVNFVSEGGTLVLFSGKNIDKNSYNELLQQLNIGQITGTDTSKVQVLSITEKSDIYTNTFDKKQKNPQLPVLKNTSLFSPELQTINEILLSDERNRPVLLKNLYGKGQVYFFSFSGDPSSGNFVFHPLWIPTIYNILLLERYSEPYYFRQGKAFNISIPNANYETEQSVHLKSTKHKTDYIMERTGDRYRKSYAMPPIMTGAGSYEAIQGSKFLRTASFNYNRAESYLQNYSADSLTKMLSANKLKNYNLLETENIKLQSMLREQQTGTDISYIFIIAALIFILLEIISLRFLKKKHRI